MGTWCKDQFTFLSYLAQFFLEWLKDPQTFSKPQGVHEQQVSVTTV